MRQATIRRSTSETSVDLHLDLEGRGISDIKSNCGFLNHMLEQFAKHALIDLRLDATGDTHIDDHHLVEDIGIALGEAISEALGDKRGILRYGFCSLAMDDALAQISLDLSGRSWLGWNLPIPVAQIGSFDSELVHEFFKALAFNGNLTLHVDLVRGQNGHHIVEAAFKAFARAFRQARSIDPDAPSEIPSTKGSL